MDFTFELCGVQHTDVIDPGASVGGLRSKIAELCNLCVDRVGMSCEGVVLCDDDTPLSDVSDVQYIAVSVAGVPTSLLYTVELAQTQPRFVLASSSTDIFVAYDLAWQRFVDGQLSFTTSCRHIDSFTLSPSEDFIFTQHSTGPAAVLWSAETGEIWHTVPSTTTYVGLGILCTPNHFACLREPFPQTVSGCVELYYWGVPNEAPILCQTMSVMLGIRSLQFSMRETDENVVAFLDPSGLELSTQKGVCSPTVITSEMPLQYIELSVDATTVYAVGGQTYYVWDRETAFMRQRITSRQRVAGVAPSEEYIIALETCVLHVTNLYVIVLQLKDNIVTGMSPCVQGAGLPTVSSCGSLLLCPSAEEGKINVFAFKSGEFVRKASVSVGSSKADDAVMYRIAVARKGAVWGVVTGGLVSVFA